MIKKIFNEEVSHFQKIDILILLVIGLVYGIISFIHLGNTYAPNTFYTINNIETINFYFSEDVDIIRLKLYTGARSASIMIDTSLDGENYDEHFDFESPGVFKWSDFRIATKARYLRITTDEELSIGEIGFFDNSRSYIPFQTITTTLSDEKETIPSKVSPMNSAYFDEVYFARTAYEYINNLVIYEWTHPPLGKIIQAIPIYITHNMSPFHYRFMGNISGILLVLVMYLFGFVLFHKRKYALTSSLIMMFDTFHFAHTRMGTVDSHLVLFSTLAIFFMILFIKKEKTYCLFLSGLFFGLSVCIKWSGFYSGLALAIIFFTYLFYYKKFHYSYIIKGFLFFVIIPLILYLGIFFVFSNNFYKTNTLSNIIKENQMMYDYHSNLNEFHCSSSKFYSWPISYRPVWYSYYNYEESNTQSSISGVGNIVIWYMGLLSMIYLLLVLIIKKDKEAFLLVVCYLSLWLPYLFISRPMFLYHYFPALPILFLGIVYFLRDLECIYHCKRVIPIFLVCSFLFFAIYYPVVSGIEVPSGYLSNLELFDSWTFN